MIWKELYAESGPRLNVLGRIVLAVLVISSFFPAGWIIYYFRYEVPYGMSNRDHFHQAINAWVRITGTVVACLLWLAIAVRASGSVTGERDRDTWDSLITTPLDSEPMYFAKWWGSICSVRWSLLWLGGLWAIGMILGGLQPIAIPLVIGAWCVLAGFFASVGMWFTTWCKTTGRATLTTMIVSLFCGGLHWFVLGMCCYMPLAWTVPGNWRFLRELTEFHAFGLTPPITLGWLAIEGDEFNHYPPDESPVKFMFYSFIGLTIWGVLALVLYVAGQERFRILSMRSFRGYPPRHEPAAADEARSWG